MAIIKIKPIKVRMISAIKYITNKEKTNNSSFENPKVHNDLFDAIDYIENDYKTEDKRFVTGINCMEKTAYEQMKKTKELHKNTEGIQAFHIIHSYDYDEITPEEAHKVGIEFAEEMFGDRFEVLVATHVNTKHYHNHIIVNSVSFIDGKKFYANRESYAVMRKVSNRICKSHGLSILEEKLTKKRYGLRKILQRL